MAAGSSKKRRNKATIQLSLFPAEEPAAPRPQLPTPPPVASVEPPEGIRKEIIEVRKKELIAKFKKQTEQARAARRNINKET